MIDPTLLESSAEAAPGDGKVAELAGNKATARVLMVLTHIARAGGAHGVSELSRELGMTKNMIYRALTTLARHGFVIRDESGRRYQLGPGVLAFAGSGLPELQLPQLCEPYMRRLRDLTGETVTLAVPSGRMAVTVLGVRGRGVIARRVPLGRVIPLHVSPASRAILAYFPDGAVDRYVRGPLETFTAASLSDERAIRAEVDAVRARGYATSFGDHWRGGSGVAFPVLASGAFPHGSLTVAGPLARFGDERVASVLPAIEQIMEELNRQSVLYASHYTGEATS